MVMVMEPYFIFLAISLINLTYSFSEFETLELGIRITLSHLSFVTICEIFIIEKADTLWYLLTPLLVSGGIIRQKHSVFIHMHTGVQQHFIFLLTTKTLSKILVLSICITPFLNSYQPSMFYMN